MFEAAKYSYGKNYKSSILVFIWYFREEETPENLVEARNCNSEKEAAERIF